jgi:hypothetical protein
VRHRNVEDLERLVVLTEGRVVLCEKVEGPEMVCGVRRWGARTDVFDDVLDRLELERVRVQGFDVAEEGGDPFLKCALEIGLDQFLERVAWKG